MEYVLPDPAINAAWGPPAKRSSLPANLGRPARLPVPVPAQTTPPRRSFREHANHCLGCKKAFVLAEPRYKLVFMPHGARGSGMRSGLGVDFCETCGPLAQAALKQFFGDDSRMTR